MESNCSFMKFSEMFVGSRWQECSLSFVVKYFHCLVSMLCFIWVFIGLKGRGFVEESSLSVLVFKNQIIIEMV